MTPSVADGDRVSREFGAAGLNAPTPIGVCITDAQELTLGGRPLKHCGWEHPF